MHRVLANERLSPNVYRLVVEAPRIAQIRKPGQFVIVHLGPGAERIPLTIADVDADAGTISLVIQAIGKSTMDLVEMMPGDAIGGVAGPLGHPTELPEAGHAVCVVVRGLCEAAVPSRCRHPRRPASGSRTTG